MVAPEHFVLNGNANIEGKDLSLLREVIALNQDNKGRCPDGSERGDTEQGGIGPGGIELWATGPMDTKPRAADPEQALVSLDEVTAKAAGQSLIPSLKAKGSSCTGCCSLEFIRIIVIKKINW